MRDKVPLDAETGQRVTANPLMLSMVASIAELRAGLEMPTTIAELYEVAARAMVGRAPPEVQALMRDTFFEAHTAGQRIITAAHLEAAAERTGRVGVLDELRRLVLSDRLPLMRLLAAEPLEMQAFHLSFQEFFAMLAVCEGARLPSYEWSAWWTNVVRMGVQTGDAFGERFAAAAARVGGVGDASRASCGERYHGASEAASASSRGAPSGGVEPVGVQRTSGAALATSSREPTASAYGSCA